MQLVVSFSWAPQPKFWLPTGYVYLEIEDMAMTEFVEK